MPLYGCWTERRRVAVLRTKGIYWAGIFLEKKNLQEGQPMQSGEDSEEDGRGDAGESCETAGSYAC